MKGKNKSKMSIMIGKTTLMLKLFPKPEKQTIKSIYNERLEKLFSRAPSNFGYISDIEGIMDELALTKEQLFHMVINSLGRSTRTKPEIRVIASYLFLMQDFLKLLKAKSPEQKENLLLKDLLTLAENVEYEKAQSNTVLMRFGEKGNNAFILLDGKVDVLIESHFQKDIGEKTYLYYIANLIKHHEFGLVNSIVNENFKKYPMEIIDDITTKNPDHSGIKQNKNTSEYNFYNNNQNDEGFNAIDNNDNENSLKKSFRHSVVVNSNAGDFKFSFNKEFFKRMGRTNTLRGTVDDTKKPRKKKPGVFRLNYVHEEFKDSHKIPQYSARELLDMFSLKLIDKRFNRQLNHVKTDDYIKRLNIFNYIKSDDLFFKVKKDKEEIFPKKHQKLFDKHKNKNKKDNSYSESNSNSEDNFSENINNKNNNNSYAEEDSSSSKSSYLNLVNENILPGMKLCTYSKIISLERGSLFGEMALNEPNALRKATIITTEDSHFAVLNKKTFNNSIKMGAQKHMKETLQFFIEIPIFNGIPEGVFYNKYYTNLSKDIIVKGKNVINQGEKPDHITLLQTGSYGLTTQMSLYDLTRLILYYADVLINQNNKSNDSPKDNKKNNNKDRKNNSNKNNDNNNKKENTKKEAKKKEENKNNLNNYNDIQKLISQESALLAESIGFKKFYNSLQFIRINEIYCPEVILNDEYIDENGLYAFTIEAKAPENTIYTLHNRFLVDLNEKNISIQKNKEKFLKQKMDVMIKRLLIIRNSLINSFLDSKAKKEIGEVVIKELEDAILFNLKRKRLLNKKEEIIINAKEKDNKEKLIQLNMNSPQNKHKNIEIGKQYKNTGDSMQEKNNSNNKYNLKTYRINEKTKSIKLQESVKFDKGSKGKTKNNKSANIKKKLLPVRVSLKTAIKFTYQDIKKENQHKNPTTKSNKSDLKINGEGLLFSVDDLNNDKYSKTNYNLNKSRNEAKINFKPFSFSNGDNNYKNYNMGIVRTPRFLMNNLIWENMKKEMKFPIKLNMDEINNFYDNSQSIENTINTNYHTYYGHKGFYNRNRYKSKNSYNNLSNNNARKTTSFSNGYSFNNIRIESQNNLCFLSSQSKKNIKQKNKSSSPKKNISNKIIEPKNNQSVTNIKKHEELLKMKIRNLISPDQIRFMRMNRNSRYVDDINNFNKFKEEKFKLIRKDYFKKNITNRINYFYRKTEAEKKA